MVAPAAKKNDERLIKGPLFLNRETMLLCATSCDRVMHMSL